MSENHSIIIHEKPKLENAALIVGWTEDAGRLAPRTLDYLNHKLGSIEFAEFELADYFPLSGVYVQDDIAQFPQIKFYYCAEKNLAILKSNTPRAEWHQYMESVLDVAQKYCNVKEIYTVGGMVYLGAHTTPRQLLMIANSHGMRETLGKYDMIANLDYETPPGQRPTLSSFLIWSAKNRGIAAATLWVPVPFYLVAWEDPHACKKVLEFIDNRLELGIDLTDLAEVALRQSERIAHLRSDSPSVNDYIEKLESGSLLSQEESEHLVHEVDDYLKRRV